MYLQLGRYLINCPYIGVFRCEAERGTSDTLDWKPEDCRECGSCVYFKDRGEARIEKAHGKE